MHDHCPANLPTHGADVGERWYRLLQKTRNLRGTDLSGEQAYIQELSWVRKADVSDIPREHYIFVKYVKRLPDAWDLVIFYLPIHDQQELTQFHVTLDDVWDYKSVKSDSMGTNVRIATLEDINVIIEIEQSATKRFGSIPELSDLAEGLAPTTNKVQQWLANGRVYLAEQSGESVGFVAAYPKDSSLYIAEISVVTSQQGKGVGSILLSRVFAWARERARSRSTTPRVSLTTFADVSWNGPWYRKRGFQEVPADAIGPTHVDKMQYDVEERGLDRPGHRRCCMLWEGAQ